MGRSDEKVCPIPSTHYRPHFALLPAGLFLLATSAAIGFHDGTFRRCCRCSRVAFADKVPQDPLKKDPARGPAYLHRTAIGISLVLPRSGRHSIPSPRDP